MNCKWIQIITILLVTATELSNTSEDDSDQVQLRRVRSAPRVKRIVGGTSISDGQWPWLVSLYGKIPVSSWLFFTLSYDNIYCGGTLIASNWVVTAAHCFSIPNPPDGIKTPSNWKIKAGSAKRTVTGIVDTLKQFWTWLTNQQTADWFYISASKIIVHPQYDANSLWLNDIALVQLSLDLPLAPADPDINVIPLPINVSSDWPQTGLQCAMQGWGCTAQGGPLQDYANGVTLPVLSSDECTSIFGNIGDTRLCAGYDLGNKGICKGDSGGPLSCPNGDNTWTLAGIASFASGDDSGNWPGGFTKVEKYIPWIQSVIRN